MQWIGQGVLNINGKDYGYGDEIPKGALTDERIKQLKKVGKIGEIPVARPPADVNKLTKEVTDLKAELKVAQGQALKLEAIGQKLANENIELKTELKATRELVSNLEAAGQELAKENAAIETEIKKLEAAADELDKLTKTETEDGAGPSDTSPQKGDKGK